MRAIILFICFCCLYGLFYLASSTAFNSIVTSAVLYLVWVFVHLKFRSTALEVLFADTICAYRASHMPFHKALLSREAEISSCLREPSISATQVICVITLHRCSLL